ncbi:glycoside hydrolase family 13 protein [Plebeiibacterium marinum]|uniref:Glycoside hydrolase family 13 protein n=1 Tax=Plebeiibacterium marinum TaxID=2992111 RepID=A0AAE3MCX3_9BACT|nr:glycoside hydrolase family 13 protein [Plebeiobacterium marinum]MCW3805431.1 glycoside hydrolase family 13 protein [Plebeiobacterium marinum]
MKPFYLCLLLILILASCHDSSHKNHDNASVSSPPQWAKDVIWYQIFVERFNNGDPTNDPTPETMYASSNFIDTPENWSVTPWTQEWYQDEEWAQKDVQDFYANLQLRRYGGDLQGVLNKLDYLKELGITAIYFNPLNDAPSLHKYDARNFRHIDVTFGPDPRGDMEIIASEIPDDPTTWKWTAADKMFLQVIEEAHKRNIKVVLDYSWNHTGVEFWAWKDVVKNQEQSKYKDWYIINSFDDPATEENEFNYEGWLNIQSLPALKKVGATEGHRPGHPYEGDLHPEVKKHVFAVTKRWLAPDGEVSKGLDGYRLDVADHIPMGFWRDYRKYVKSINPEAYLVGEIWWEEWPEKMMNPVPYVSGDVFDAVMHYQVYRPARCFFAKNDYQIDAKQFVDSLKYQWGRISEETAQAMMNVAATHDSPRLLTSFANKGKYKYRAKPSDDPDYITSKPNEDTYQRVKLYLMHQFTSVGAPQIWNGDEFGMWGGDDPDCRKPLWWPEYQFNPENKNNIQDKEKEYVEVCFNEELYAYYKQMTDLRNKNIDVFAEGSIEFVKAEGKLLAYLRKLNDTEVLVVLNAGEESVTYNLQPSKTYKDLIKGVKVSRNELVLEALSGKVLLVE